MSDFDQAENTDTEIWRGPDEGGGDYYADSLHMTKEGLLGINCGGSVHVRAIREWHRLAGGPINGLPKEDAETRTPSSPECPPPAIFSAPNKTFDSDGRPVSDPVIDREAIARIVQEVLSDNLDVSFENHGTWEIIGTGPASYKIADRLRSLTAQPSREWGSERNSIQKAVIKQNIGIETKSGIE